MTDDPHPETLDLDQDEPATRSKAPLADFILLWLRERNGGELAEAFDSMTVGDARLLREELIYILRCGGRPSNWVRP